MTKIYTVTLGILFLLLLATDASAATITVSPSSGSIQAAIDSATAGDTVYVKSGTYYEHVILNKPITLQGEDKSTTIIDGGGAGTVVYANGISNLVISDFTVKNGNAGIYLERSTNNLVKNVIVANNIGNGVNLGDQGSSYNTLQNIEASSNTVGIIAYAGSNNMKVIDSKLHDNSEDGVLIGWSSGWVIENTVSYSNGRAGVGIDTASRGTIRNCILYNNIEGIGSGGLGESGNTIVGNTIYSNKRGIRFDSNDINNDVIENKIYDNQVGIYLYQWAQYPSYNNRFYHNDLRNTKNCDAPGDTILNNQWDSGYPDGGNFYSDYTGVDQLSGAGQNEGGADGIGDSTYIIPLNNIDHYPLMKPWHRDFPSGKQPPVANAGESYQANEGSPVTFDASLSNDPDEDTLQYRWDFESDGTWDTQWSNEPVATHTWNDDWNGKATLEVSDGEHYATDTATVTVNNVKPTLNKIVSPIDPIIVNTPIKTTCTFSDVGTADTHTVVWDWGDGSSPGLIDNTNGVYTATGEHVYTLPGVYWVTCTVSDDGGSASLTVENYVVVYNPEGGFVTGGGWINSPAGAYMPDNTLAGKATFGFVSKYQKGATVPTGKTEFQFKVANLNFHSENYDWLVVAGSQAKYKGTGTINGEGNYGFMLSAVDGAIKGDVIDKFRIKIWNKGSNDIIIYDNEVGKGDDVEPSTAIGGGSIVVHKEE